MGQNRRVARAADDGPRGRLRSRWPNVRASNACCVRSTGRGAPFIVRPRRRRRRRRCRSRHRVFFWFFFFKFFFNFLGFFPDHEYRRPPPDSVFYRVAAVKKLKKNNNKRVFRARCDRKPTTSKSAHRCDGREFFIPSFSISLVCLLDYFFFVFFFPRRKDGVFTACEFASDSLGRKSRFYEYSVRVYRELVWKTELLSSLRRKCCTLNFVARIRHRSRGLRSPTMFVS